MKESKYLAGLFVCKKNWEKKLKLFHTLFHRYERLSNFFILLTSLVSLPFIILAKAKETPLTLLIFLFLIFLVSLLFSLYFLKRSLFYRKKMKECSLGISHAEKHIIETLLKK